MIDLRVVELASDTNLVRGIYNTCDQWCDYCPSTTRCLSFRLHDGPPTLGAKEADFGAAMFASMARLRDCYEAEGLEIPEDMQELLAGRPGQAPPSPDPIERMAEQYLVLVPTFVSRGGHRAWHTPFASRPDGPLAAEVFLSITSRSA